jgi:hypothetical protein
MGVFSSGGMKASSPSWRWIWNCHGRRVCERRRKFESRFNGNTTKYLDYKKHHLHANPFRCCRRSAGNGKRCR